MSVVKCARSGDGTVIRVIWSVEFRAFIDIRAYNLSGIRLPFVSGYWSDL